MMMMCVCVACVQNVPRKLSREYETKGKGHDDQNDAKPTKRETNRRAQ